MGTKKQQSMFTNEEFKFMSDVFCANRPELAIDSAKVEKEIQKLDAEVDEHFTTLRGSKDESEKENFVSAISILLQVRNFLARFLGKDERLIPEVEVTEADPIEKKHVAVWIQGAPADSPIAKATKQAFDLNRELLRYRIYPDARAIIGDLPKLCGIISLSISKKASVESYLRHDLKNMPGWNYELAYAAVLPPCEDHDILQISLAMLAILKMQQGQWSESDRKAGFYLKAAMSSLVPHMRVPDRKTTVVIVDDTPAEILGMSEILEAWPNVTLAKFTASRPTSVEQLASDILLLDEDLAAWATTGTEIFNRLHDRHLLQKMVVASTTSGNKPRFTRWHFPAKGMVAKSFDQALDFVRFMNKLIAEVSP